MASAKRSPLKDRPLHNPGQSVDEELFDLLFDKLLTPAMLVLFLCLLAGLEWWVYFNPAPRNPIVYTAFALLGLIFLSWRFWRLRPKVHQLRLARDGEKAVGIYLERLRQHGYQVFHDVVGTDFNIDHVLIGPAGVFTVETKTHSKPSRGDARIVFDGENVHVNGRAPDRNPVIQAKAQAGWLRGLLSESTGRKFDVRPIVVYPGWFVEQKADATRQVWVLEPKALPGFLAHQRETLTSEDVKLASFHLSRFIRA